MSPILPKITVSTGEEGVNFARKIRPPDLCFFFFLHYTIAIYIELRQGFLLEVMIE